MPVTIESPTISMAFGCVFLIFLCLNYVALSIFVTAASIYIAFVLGVCSVANFAGILFFIVMSMCLTISSNIAVFY